LGVQGAVVLRLTIDPRGVPKKVEALDGPSLLRPVAEALLSRWRFEPTVIEGKPAQIQSLLTVPFTLHAEPYPKGRAPIEAVVLELKDTSRDATTPLDLAPLRQAARDWLSAQGLQCVVPTGADPLGTVFLNLEVETFLSPSGAKLFALSERCSLLRDRDLRFNEPGQPQRIYVFRHTVGQRADQDSQDGLLVGLRSLLRELLQVPVSRAALQAEGRMAGPVTAGAIPSGAVLLEVSVKDFEFSQVKIKHQPPAPHYPLIAKVNRIQGTVVIELTIDPTGQPLRALALEGPVELAATAVDYALQWEFEPARLNGVPQYARFRLTMPFKLH
jgi:TonB family protein